MDLLTKEEKDKLVEQRIADMKKKNEAIRKKQAEVEAEKKLLGAAAAPPRAVIDTDYKSPQYKDDWEGREIEERFGSDSGSAWPGQSPEDRPENRWEGSGEQNYQHTPQSRRGRGVYRGGSRGAPRGGGGAFNQSFNNSPQQQYNIAQAEEDWGSDASSPQQQTPTTPNSAPRTRGGFNATPPHSRDGFNATPPHSRGGFDSTPPHSRGGRGGYAGSGRIAQNSRVDERPSHRYDQSYDERRKKNAQEYEASLSNERGGHGFLTDNFRDSPSQHPPGEHRTNRDIRGGHDGGRGGGPRRHPRNYGAVEEGSDLREKIKRDRQRSMQQGEGSGADFNPDLHMTGRQRVEHSKWKEDRERCDHERIQRAKNSQGEWKRDWDVEKKPQPIDNESSTLPPQLDMYKEMDSKKMTKRVGSGRFVIDAAAADKKSSRTSRPGPGAGMRGIRGSTPGSTRGRGRGQRPRKNSQEAAASDRPTHPGDKTRQVNDTEADLRVTINTTPTAASKESVAKSPRGNNQGGTKPSNTQHKPSTQSTTKHRPNNQTRRSNSGELHKHESTSNTSSSHQHSNGQKRNQNEGHRSSHGGQGRGGGGRRHSDKEQGSAGGDRQESGVTNRESGDGKIPAPEQAKQEAARSAPPSEPQPSANESKPTSKSTNSSSSSKAPPASSYYYYPTPAKAKPRPAVIQIEGGEGEDEEGWEDCESDEDFYTTNEEITPQASKEATPALSKESTPVPQGSDSGASGTEAALTSTETQSDPTQESADIIVLAESDSPPKAKLHIDIRDPLNEDEEEIEDVLKTPEGGRKHLDWAAEMDDESPMSTPAVKIGD